MKKRKINIKLLKDVPLNVLYENIDFSQYASSMPLSIKMLKFDKMYDRNISQNLFRLKSEEKNSVRTEINLQIFS